MDGLQVMSEKCGCLPLRDEILYSSFAKFRYTRMTLSLELEMCGCLYEMKFYIHHLQNFDIQVPQAIENGHVDQVVDEEQKDNVEQPIEQSIEQQVPQEDGEATLRRSTRAKRSKIPSLGSNFYTRIGLQHWSHKWS